MLFGIGIQIQDFFLCQRSCYKEHIVNQCRGCFPPGFVSQVEVAGRGKQVQNIIVSCKVARGKRSVVIFIKLQFSVVVNFKPVGRNIDGYKSPFACRQCIIGIVILTVKPAAGSVVTKVTDGIEPEFGGSVVQHKDLIPPIQRGRVNPQRNT